MQTIGELIHADTFSDLLELAEHLLSEKYKEAAAVMAGGALESHLRNLADKHKTGSRHPDGKRKKVETIAQELVTANVFSSLEKKGITYWYGIRTEAAHGEDVEASQVAQMIPDITAFISRYPA
jgi:hypothetical protein